MKKKGQSEICVHIIGSNTFTNQVLINLIQTELGYFCTDGKQLDDLKSSMAVKTAFSKEMILWDCQSAVVNSLWAAMGEEEDINLPDIYKVAVFNVPGDSDVGLNLLRYGGHGIFYQKDSPNIFIKGIKTIVAGELWFSRDVANKYIRKTRDHKKHDRDNILTNREKEILSCLPLGNSNEDIAGTFNISPHTVRTHLSNIYGKLKVNNRFQAALWASENLL